MEIRTIVVDDEKLARDELCYLLKSIPDIKVVGQATNGIETFELIRELQPDLVFLDIQMPGGNGLSVAEELELSKDAPYVIFVTAYDEYALKAFEVNAIDYLLKPIVDKERLQQSIGRVKDQMGQIDYMAEKINSLVNSLRDKEALSLKSHYLPRLSVNMGGHLRVIDVDKIIYTQVLDGIVNAVTEDGEGTTGYRTLDELESALDPTKFWRVHRSYIANINKIEEIIPWFSGTHQLKMSDKEKSRIPLSRAHSRRLRKFLKW